MSLLTSSIDLDTITAPAIPNSQFPSDQVDQLANLFLKAGDTVSPILVRKVSPIAFEVLEGHFEYYAAIKAQEIDEQFTAIRAYVVPPELESTILEQYQFLRSPSPATPIAIDRIVEEQIPTPAPVNHAPTPDLAKIEEAVANRLEQKLTAAIDRIVEDQISSSLKVFTNQITQQLDTHLLDIKNSLSSSASINKTVEPIIQPTNLSAEPVSQKTVKDKTSAKSKTKSEKSPVTAKKQNLANDSKALQVLNDLNMMNVAEIQHKLSKVKRIKNNLAQLIHAQRIKQPDQKFQSIPDLIKKVDGIAEKTMQTIIESW